MHFYCVTCERPALGDYRPFCDCGGMIEVRYDLTRVTLHDSDNPYVRYAELLPFQPGDASLPDTRFTPTIHARALGGSLGMPALYLKDESALPTRSTKDRMAVVALRFLRERGVRTFCTSSTGNSSTAYANAIRALPDMHLRLFTAERFSARVHCADHSQVEHYGLRDATFVEAFDCAGAWAKRDGHTSERGFFNLGRREGLKLAFFEAAEQVPQPIDWYVQAVSSAMGVYGTYKGAKELLALGRIARVPRLLCVQQETCAPMVRAFEDGSPSIRPHDLVARPTGIAEAILRGDPTRVYPYVRGQVLECNGRFVAVSEAEIRDARRRVEELEGVSPCYSAATALAGLIKSVRDGHFPVHDTVLVNLTGGDRPLQPPSPTIRWLERDHGEWVPAGENDGRGVGMIVVVGGGIAGAFTAFALARAGASPILIERAGVAREASVRNPGGLNPLHGAGIPGPMQAFALESFRLNIDPRDELRTRSGINFHGRTVSRIHVVLDDKDRASLEPMKAIQDATPGFGARWLDRPELIAIEPRITPTALGALRVEGNARVDAQAYTRAVTAAAVSLGARVVVDEVTGLESRGARVSGVVLGSGTIRCDGVVIASGVWTDAPAQWLGVTLPIETWKGELLIADIDGAPVVHTFSCRDGSVYGDGTNRVWIGGTEAQVGFDQTPTPEGRALLFERAQRFFPAIAEARVVSQVAGVRPVSADGLPIVGPAPGWDNAWLALGGGRKGILYGAGMGQAVAELATRGQTRLSIAACAPSRFGERRDGATLTG